MIDFFFKKKELVLDCFTYDGPTYENSKIVPAVKIIPSWFKSTPAKYKYESRYVDYNEAPTVKSCYGILEYFKQSFVIPMWSDITIKITEEDLFWEFFKGLDEVIIHENILTNNVFSDTFFHIKFLPPWHIRCNQDLNVLFVEPFWNSCVNENVFNLLHIQPGMVNFKITSTPNVNVFIKKTNDRFKIEHGSPLVQMFPMTDKTVKLKNHLVTYEEFKKIALEPPYTALQRAKKAREMLKND